MALLGRFFGRTVSEGAAYAFGVATGPVLAPATESIRQEAWDHYRSRIPGVASLAAGVAQGQVAEDQARSWAGRQGFGDAAFSALVDVANTGPDVGMAMQAWRRGKLTEAEFRTVLRRHAIETQWDSAIEALKVELLAPAELARAIHRGLIPDPGLLQGTLPSGVGNVPAYPVYPIDALQEAEAFGIDRDRLGVMVGLQGLPMGSHEAAQALFRGVLTEDDFLRAIAEGNTRNEWADAIREQSRQILTSSNGVAAFIRGWIDRARMHAIAARHGMTSEDADLLALISGRPVTTRQAFIGFIRGGRVAGQSWNERETFRRAVIQSNIRPEWEPILWAQRFTYPSAFVLRSLVQSGDITRDDGYQALIYSAWEPTFAAKVADAWAQGGGGTTADPNVTKAHNQLWTATHRSYLLQEIDRAEAETALTRFIPDAAARAAVLDTWDAERGVTIKSLTPSQVKSAYTQAVIPLDTALAELTRLGYDQESAARLLGTVQPAVSIPAIMAGVEADVRAGLVDAVEAIARLTAVGVKSADAAALVQQWEGG